MEWHSYNDIHIYNVANNTKENILFVAIQEALIRSASTKTKATIDDWVFYSDNVPDYLYSLTEWKIVLYDYEYNPDLLNDIISYIHGDFSIIITQKGEVVQTYLKYSRVKLSSASCIIGNEVYQSLPNYRPHSVFPRQDDVLLPEGRAILMTVGSKYSLREKPFKKLQYPIVMKEGNWKREILELLREHNIVVLIGDNASTEERLEVIACKVPVYAYLFTYSERRDDEYSSRFSYPNISEGLNGVYRMN